MSASAGLDAIVRPIEGVEGDRVCPICHETYYTARGVEICGLCVEAGRAAPAPVAPAPVAPAPVAPAPVVTTVACPDCQGPMIRRVANHGRRSGQAFMGCARFPRCRGTRPLDETPAPVAVPVPLAGFTVPTIAPIASMIPNILDLIAPSVEAIRPSPDADRAIASLAGPLPVASLWDRVPARATVPPTTAELAARNAPVDPFARARAIPYRAGRAPQAPETPAQAAERQARAAALAARAELDGLISLSLSGGTGDYAHGCIAAWDPAGDRTWADVARAAEIGGVMPPARRSDRAIASDAVDACAHAGLRVAVVKRGSEWSVYRPAGVSSVGASIGQASLVARLDGDRLVLDGPADLCATVRTAWDRARANAVIGSTEITTWLSGLLTSWRAVRVVYGRWVPPAMVARWRRLACALNDAGIPVPARPAEVHSLADVSDLIAGGLRAEVATQIKKIGEKRDQAREKAKSKDLGADGAITALDEIASLRSKLALYEAVAGPMAPERAALRALELEIRALVPQASGVDLDRFAEIRRDG